MRSLLRQIGVTSALLAPLILGSNADALNMTFGDVRVRQLFAPAR